MMEDGSDRGAPMLFERLPSSVFVCVFLFVAAVQRTQIGLVSRLFARVAQARLKRDIDGKSIIAKFLKSVCIFRHELLFSGRA